MCVVSVFLMNLHLVDIILVVLCGRRLWLVLASPMQITLLNLEATQIKWRSLLIELACEGATLTLAS